MAINRLIALGGRGVKSPVERFIETKGQMERGRLRQVQERAGNQNIDINRRREGRDARQDRVNQIAPYAKAVLTADPDERQQVYEQAKQQLTAMGIDMSQAPQVPDMANMAAVMEAGGLELDETKAPIKRTMPAGTNNQGQNMVVDRLYEGDKVIEESKPYVKKEITREAAVDAADYGGLTTGASTKLDKDVMTQLQMRDSINVLSRKYKAFKDSGYSKNRLMSWASGIGNMAENLGVPLPEGWSEANASHDDLMTASGRVFDAYRKKVTGSQAAVAELDRYLSKRVPNEGDAVTRFEAKLQAIIEFDEIATIRLSKLKKDGWIYAGVAGEDDNQTAIVSKDGKAMPISQAMSLDEIPMFTDRRNQIMTELAGSRLREDISPSERKKMAAKTTRRLKAEGYNVDAR